MSNPYCANGDGWNIGWINEGGRASKWRASGTYRRIALSGLHPFLMWAKRSQPVRSSQPMLSPLGAHRNLLHVLLLELVRLREVLNI